jgi:hypothetical protein
MLIDILLRGLLYPVPVPCSSLRHPFPIQTLQKYTREYLLEKFKADYSLQTPTLSPSTTRSQRSPTVNRLPPLPQGSRPILAIDTAPTHISNRQPSVSVSRGVSNGENTLPPMASMPELSPNTATSAGQCLKSWLPAFIIVNDRCLFSIIIVD